MATAKKTATIKYHPKAPDAGPEHVRRLAGLVALRGPVPSTKFMDAAVPRRSAERAGD
jgi:hypothetical protein